MKTRKPILRKREKPRRKRPELIFKGPKKTLWRSISLAIRKEWWEKHGPGLPCGICHKGIMHFEDLSADHIIPGKMGGLRDHSLTNLQPSHLWCNQEKGSKRKPREMLPTMEGLTDGQGAGVG